MMYAQKIRHERYETQRRDMNGELGAITIERCVHECDTGRGSCARFCCKCDRIKIYHLTDDERRKKSVVCSGIVARFFLRSRRGGGKNEKS